MEGAPTKPELSDDFKDLIEKMLKHNSEDRITAFEALNHPWLKDATEKPDGFDEEMAKRYHLFEEREKYKLIQEQEKLRARTRRWWKFW